MFQGETGGDRNSDIEDADTNIRKSNESAIFWEQKVLQGREARSMLSDLPRLLLSAKVFLNLGSHFRCGTIPMFNSTHAMIFVSKISVQN